MKRRQRRNEERDLWVTQCIMLGYEFVGKEMKQQGRRKGRRPNKFYTEWHVKAPPPMNTWGPGAPSKWILAKDILQNRGLLDEESLRRGS